MEETDLISNFKRYGKLVYIKQPDFCELEYVSELWNDEETMRDVGGTILFPEDKRDAWFKRMVYPTDEKNFYCLIYTLDNVPVGEVSFHRFDKEAGTADFNIKIHNKHRGQGYAGEAIQMLLSFYFYNFNGQVIFDNVANENGQKALEKFGFEIVSANSNEVLFKLTKERFLELAVKRGLKREKSCGAVVIRDESGFTEFLLISNKDNYWGFPKGHVEGQEEEIQTAVREVLEETGLAIEILDSFREDNDFFVSADTLKKVVFFIGKSSDDNVRIQQEEINSFKWLSYKEALELLTFESDKELLIEVQEFLESSR
jgi:8-oxo-dGTP pyrophosphatase MutT (NUDIX family)/RimJ/RimL family protein N-acetyltransferase